MTIRTGRVEGESRPVTDDSAETGQESEREVGSGNGRRCFNERTGSSCILRDRYGHGDGGSRDDEDFCDEGVSKVVRVDEEERKLNKPEQEIGSHVDGRDTSRFGKLVGNVEVTGPNGVKELSHGETSVVSFDSEPDQGEEKAGDDGEEGEVVTHRGTNGDREGNPVDQKPCEPEFR